MVRVLSSVMGAPLQVAFERAEFVRVADQQTSSSLKPPDRVTPEVPRRASLDGDLSHQAVQAARVSGHARDGKTLERTVSSLV